MRAAKLPWDRNLLRMSALNVQSGYDSKSDGDDDDDVDDDGDGEDGDDDEKDHGTSRRGNLLTYCAP